MLIFGASTTFTPLVLSRCFQGVFNGNVGVYDCTFCVFPSLSFATLGVSKSMIAEVLISIMICLLRHLKMNS